MVQAANTSHDSGSHDDTNSMLLIIEHRGFGLASAPNPVLKVTNWTDSGAAINGSPARWASGSRRRCRPRFANPGCDLARPFAGKALIDRRLRAVVGIAPRKRRSVRECDSYDRAPSAGVLAPYRLLVPGKIMFPGVGAYPKPWKLTCAISSEKLRRLGFGLRFCARSALDPNAL